MAEINTGLVERIERLNARKVELETTKAVKEKSLKELDDEITKQGYDPLRLPELIKETQERIHKFEEETIPKLNEIEKNVSSIKSDISAPDGFIGFEGK